MAARRHSKRRSAVAQWLAAVAVLAMVEQSGEARAIGPHLTRAADRALMQAVAFFRTQAAVRGSYVWIYTADLSKRRGEGDTTPTQGWVQPPGTPAVGLAYLQAYERTGKRELLDAAVETAHALAATQLESGGWWPLIEFDPEARKAWCYRAETDCRTNAAAMENKDRNATTIDDDISQSALRLLMLVDHRLGQRDTKIHEAAVYGLRTFIEAQYPNGAWPNRFDRAAPHEQVAPMRRARFPVAWSRTYTKISGPLVYILNDNALRDVISTFLLAHRLYGSNDYLAAAMRAGDFLLAAQMPKPQRGWAQVYDGDMQPIWGRKFEPPAISARETSGSLEALLALYLHTREERYLKAAGEAAKWLRATRRTDGRWARFYELRTNRPLYMTADYKLTYQDKDMPRHYSFAGTYDIPRTLALYEAVARARAHRATINENQMSSPRVESAACLAPSVAKVIASLDRAGRWVENGRISSATFIDNVSLLSRYLAAAHATGETAVAACEANGGTGPSMEQPSGADAN